MIGNQRAVGNPGNRGTHNRGGGGPLGNTNGRGGRIGNQNARKPDSGDPRIDVDRARAREHYSRLSRLKKEQRRAQDHGEGIERFFR
jgi:hypothetical protein